MRKTRHHAYIRRRGIMVADALVGLFLAATLLTLVALVTSSHRRAEAATQQQHMLLTHAELTLLALQHGEAADLPDAPGIEIEIKTLDDDQVSGGYVWAEVIARHETAEASLVGWVPSAMIEKEASDD